jgi:hypothetical protein
MKSDMFPLHNVEKPAPHIVTDDWREGETRIGRAASTPKGKRANLLFGRCHRSRAIPCDRLLDRSTNWWSQTGSNRRPHACKARALPAELWPQTVDHSQVRRHAPTRMVGLGRLELPTSRLSSARSNQLSYKPEPRGSTRRNRLNCQDRLNAKRKARPKGRKRNEGGDVPHNGSLTRPLF